MDDQSCILLLISPGPDHVYDAYLEEILLTEGYNCYEKRTVQGGDEINDMDRFPLVFISSGAAQYLDPQVVAEYVAGGGRVVMFKPPREWAPLFGLERPSELYCTARNAYIGVNSDHPWMQQFSHVDLQCHGEAHFYACTDAEPIAFMAGQRGQRSAFSAVAVHRAGSGAAAFFGYDLAETIVLFHQGRPEHSSTGADPDANRDGKFAPDDFFEGMRDFHLRHVPQADVHQDILVRLLQGLMADAVPLPRLWHFPAAAPALLFVDGDGDSMTWEDLDWVVENTEEFGARYTLYLMTEQIETFDPERIAALRARGHEFGVHPWVGVQPDLDTWGKGLADIITAFTDKFGYRPTSTRAHSVIFPGWDENPKLLADHGLRMETSFACGYRYQSGYANGSALPAKFISRDGQVLDCYEQSTVQTEDGSASHKCLLPPLDEQQAFALARKLMHELAQRYHGVFHPYFHPRNLAGRGAVACQTWYREVLRTARDLGMPSLNATEWLAFSDARRAVTISDRQWQDGSLHFTLAGPLPVAGLTVLLPACSGMTPASATVAGEAAELLHLPYEGMQWWALTLDLTEDASVRVQVDYAVPTR